jgi:hypothetical protein
MIGPKFVLLARGSVYLQFNHSVQCLKNTKHKSQEALLNKHFFVKMTTADRGLFLVDRTTGGVCAARKSRVEPLRRPVLP